MKEKGKAPGETPRSLLNPKRPDAASNGSSLRSHSRQLQRTRQRPVCPLETVSDCRLESDLKTVTLPGPSTTALKSPPKTQSAATGRFCIAGRSTAKSNKIAPQPPATTVAPAPLPSPCPGPAENWRRKIRTNTRYVSMAAQTPGRRKSRIRDTGEGFFGHGEDRRAPNITQPHAALGDATGCQ